MRGKPSSRPLLRSQQHFFGQKKGGLISELGQHFRLDAFNFARCRKLCPEVALCIILRNTVAGVVKQRKAVLRTRIPLFRCPAKPECGPSTVLGNSFACFVGVTNIKLSVGVLFHFMLLSLRLVRMISHTISAMTATFAATMPAK